MVGALIFVGGYIAGQAREDAGTKPAARHVTTEVVVPEACLDAFGAAEEIMVAGTRQAGVTVRWIRLVSKAVGAFTAAELNEITATMQRLTRRTEALTAEVGASPFREFTGECREAVP